MQVCACDALVRLDSPVSACVIHASRTESGGGR